MKLVIDIPEEEYNGIEPFLNGEKIKGGFNLYRVLEIVMNGTPLPKGHGRLIDADKEIYELNEMKVQGETFTTAVNFAKILMRKAPTIIEADKVESEKI